MCEEVAPVAALMYATYLMAWAILYGLASLGAKLDREQKTVWKRRALGLAGIAVSLAIAIYIPDFLGLDYEAWEMPAIAMHVPAAIWLFSSGREDSRGEEEAERPNLGSDHESANR